MIEMDRLKILAEKVGFRVEDGLLDTTIFKRLLGRVSAELHVKKAENKFIVTPYACGKIILWEREWKGHCWGDLISKLEYATSPESTLMVYIDGVEQSVVLIDRDAMISDDIRYIEFVFLYPLEVFESDRNVFTDILKSSFKCVNVAGERVSLYHWQDSAYIGEY